MPPPKDILNLEKKLLTRLFHLATSALDYSGYMNLSQYGFPKVASACASLRAAMMRSALVTVSSWRLEGTDFERVFCASPRE